MDGNIFSTLIQIPFIAAFIWFSLKLQTQFRQDSKEREAHWLAFLSQERTERQLVAQNGLDQMAALTGSLEAISQALISLTREIVDHNAGSDERYQQIQSSLEAVHRRLDDAHICKNWEPRTTKISE